MAYTTLQIEAKLVLLHSAYDKLASSHIESYSAGGRQVLLRKMEDIRTEIEWWNGQLTGNRSGGIRNRNAVPA